ncbi:MAG: c-type cytochrome [Betaproteobacteria bacterium]
MKKVHTLAIVMSLAGSMASGAAQLEQADRFCVSQYNQCLASTATPVAKGEETKSSGAAWNGKDGDKVAALKLKGDLARGKKSYEICAGCHLTTGSGLPKINLPQIAGQHTSVIIKQLSDLRAGIRYAPTMEPFALTRKGPQELADLAAYIGSLCIPAEHGRYEAADASQKIAEGKALYVEKCEACHGAKGDGDKAKFYPMLAGQHYQYLTRQLIEIRDGTRRNSDPDMVKALKKFSDNDRVAVSAYVASLNGSGKTCQ